MSKRALLYYLLSLIGIHYLNAQTASKIPVFEHKLSRVIIEELSQGKLDEARAATRLSYIGEYLKAQAIPYDGPLDWGFDSITIEDKNYFQNYQAYPAVRAIAAAAQAHRIVMLNEAHHKPAHRVFTRSLLKALYDKGYAYIGLETLANINDSIKLKFGDGQSLQQRGYPLNSMLSGIYTSEPQMSNLIREAIAIGYTVFAYEQTGAEREQKQAEQIAEILAADPTAKIVIHCGWYHLLEQEHKGKRWMASYLKAYTGLDPLTIYQDILVERYASQESPFYQLIQSDDVLVFKNEEGAFYNGFSDNQFFDILLYHPRTKFIKNRPSWLVNYPGIQLFDVQGLDVAYPCLIKAYNTAEPSEAMPIDIIEKDYKNDPTALCLPKGAYRLEVQDAQGACFVKEVLVD